MRCCTWFYCAAVAAAAVAIALAALAPGLVAASLVPGRRWAPLRQYPVSHNPQWGMAAFRAHEHSQEPSFMQWYYVMISDAELRRVYSVGFGAFRSEQKAGGWLKAFNLYEPGSQHAPWPERWLPFEAMQQHGAALNATTSPLNVTVGGGFEEAGGVSQPAFEVAELGPDRLRYVARFPPLPGSANDEGDYVDVVFTRDFGVVSGGTGRECAVANLPFAYASRVEGSLRLHGRTFRFSHAPRYRGYVETTWGCTFPQPGPQQPGGGGTAREYPVREGRGRRAGEGQRGSARCF